MNETLNIVRWIFPRKILTQENQEYIADKYDALKRAQELFLENSNFRWPPGMESDAVRKWNTVRNVSSGNYSDQRVSRGRYETMFAEPPHIYVSGQPNSVRFLLYEPHLIAIKKGISNLLNSIEGAQPGILPRSGVRSIVDIIKVRVPLNKRECFSLYNSRGFKRPPLSIRDAAEARFRDEFNIFLNGGQPDISDFFRIEWAQAILDTVLSVRDVSGIKEKVDS